MSKKTISVLVVNHNLLEMTSNLVDDLLNQTYPGQIIVINNGCNDDQKYVPYNPIDPHHNTIKIVENTVNVDLNYLWDCFGRETQSDYLCCLSNDTRVHPNFLETAVNVLDNEPSVGIAMHVTNNEDYFLSGIKKGDEEYEILDPPLCQGWDWTIRKNIFPGIRYDRLRIFGGDDHLFATIVKQGWRTALIYNSPILHYKEQTRKLIHDIRQIQKNDGRSLKELIQEEGLDIVTCTFTNGVCKRYPSDRFMEMFHANHPSTADKY